MLRLQHLLSVQVIRGTGWPSWEDFEGSRGKPDDNAVKLEFVETTNVKGHFSAPKFSFLKLPCNFITKHQWRMPWNWEPAESSAFAWWLYLRTPLGLRNVNLVSWHFGPIVFQVEYQRDQKVLPISTSGVGKEGWANQRWTQSQFQLSLSSTWLLEESDS